MEEEVKNQATLPWGLIATYIGLIVSLVWNYINYKRAGSFRDAAIKLDEFRGLRSPVDSALGQLRSDSSSLHSLEASGADVENFTELVGSAQRQVTDSYNDLESALRILDGSSFAEGRNWTSTLSPLWDAFVDSLDRAYAPHRSAEQKLDIVRDAAGKLDSLINTVQKMLEDEIKKHHLKA